MFGYEFLSQPLYQLSRLLYEAEEPEFDVEAWVAGAHPLDDHALEHPLVTALVAEDTDGPAAALAYLAEQFDDGNPRATVRWMKAGAFKGKFPDTAAFARDQFEDELADHIEAWDQRENIGFPLDLDMCEAVDWEFIGETLDNGDDWEFIETDGGVFVFDATIGIDDYLDEE